MNTATLAPLLAEVDDLVAGADRVAAGRGLATRHLLDQARPITLFAPVLPPEDEAWHAVADDRQRLAETAWALRVGMMGPVSFTAWQGSTAWDALEPAVADSSSW
ncbi:hypothetical protein ACQBAT_09050 [Ornithinimicrobium sp. Y1847]|uniref:hypothetical protein n=1 Tax=Ornithinimicrobium sp. Y1847 TaxID=3405419 RepID=UPI003B67D694